MGAQSISNLQRELLKIYSTDIPDNDLLDIKIILSTYFADKATKEMDNLWKENNWDQQTMNQWANEHNRRKDSH